MKKTTSFIGSIIVLGLTILIPVRSATAAATVPFTCSNAFIYENTDDIANPSALSKLNLAGTSITKSAFGTASGAINAMGYRTQDNFLYAIGRGEANHNNLFKYDSAGGETDLGAVDGLDVDKDLVSGAFASDGFLYAFTGDNDATMYKINVTDHTSTTIALGTHASINDIGYNVNDGLFYGYDSGEVGSSTDGRLVSISTSGAVTQIGSISDYSFYDMGAVWVFGNQFFGIENRTGIMREFALAGANAGTVVSATFTLSPPDGEPGSSAQHDGANCATASLTSSNTTPALPDTAANAKNSPIRPWAAILLSTAIVSFAVFGGYVLYRKKH